MTRTSHTPGHAPECLCLVCEGIMQGGCGCLTYCTLHKEAQAMLEALKDSVSSFDGVRASIDLERVRAIIARIEGEA